MRVLYFHQHFSTRQGSVGTRSYEFAKALIARGHSVVMVCGSYENGCTGLTQSQGRFVRRGTVEGIDVIEILLEYSNKHGFFKRSWTFFKYALVSMYLACTERGDLVFATSTPLTAALPGIAAKIFKRRTFVFEVRDLWPELPIAMGIIRSPFLIAALQALEWVAYRCADRCIALAPGIAEGVKRRGPAELPVHTIPNGCDLDLFRPINSKSARTPFGIPADRVVAVFSGAHGVANGLDALLDAAAELQRRNSQIHILLIGEGKLKLALRTRVQRESLTNVTFLDPIPKQTLAKVLPLCDIGLQILADVPEFYNATSPNKFFDYLSSGLPVVTNYPGWIADLITEHGCGVVAHGMALAEALDVLARTPVELIRMGQNSRRLAETKFDRSGLASEFIAALDQAGPRS